MAILKQSQVLPKNEKGKQADKSIYVADEKIDRDGNSWKKQSIWIRSEHLGKMKVISHFEKKSIQSIIDTAISEYIRSHWDDSMAIKKMIKKSGY